MVDAEMADRMREAAYALRRERIAALTQEQRDLLMGRAVGDTLPAGARKRGLRPYAYRYQVYKLCKHIGARNATHAVALLVAAERAMGEVGT